MINQSFMTEARMLAGCGCSRVDFLQLESKRARAPLTLPLSPWRGEESHDVPASTVFQPIPANSSVFLGIFATPYSLFPGIPAYSNLFQLIPAYSRIKKFSPDTNV